MLLFYLLTLLTIAFPIHAAIVHNYDNDMGKEWFNKEAEIYFRKRCWHNRRQLRYALRELRTFNSCFDQLFSSMKARNDEAVRENCFVKREEVTECFKATVDLLEPCLTPDENYLPDFAMQSFEAFSQYLCENAHLTTMKGLTDTNMVTCIDRFTRSQFYHPHYLCYQMAQFGNHSYNEPLLKDEFCEDLDHLYDCFERQYQQHCPDAPRAWEFQSGLLDALRSPCNEGDGQETTTEGDEEIEPECEVVENEENEEEEDEEQGQEEICGEENEEENLEEEDAEEEGDQEEEENQEEEGEDKEGEEEEGSDEESKFDHYEWK